MHAEKTVLNTGRSMGFIRNPSLFIGDHYEYGDFYRLSLPLQPLFVVTDPKVAQHILVKEEMRYEKSRIYWGQLKAIVGNSIGTLEGDAWVWLKNIHKPWFTRPASAEYLPAACEISREFVEKWQQKAEKSPLNVIEAFAHLNLSILLQTVFGNRHAADVGDIANAIADGEAIIAWRSQYPWRPFLTRFTDKHRRTLKYLAFFDDLAQREIARTRRENKTPACLLDGLVQTLDNDPEKRLGEAEIRNEFVVYLGAGTETVSVSQGWTVYLLARHPEYAERIRAEIETATQGGPLEVKHLPDLKWTEWVIKESLRLYPPSHALVRDCVHPDGDQIGGTRIRRGDTLFISVYGLHHNPRLWPDPETFRPERFEHEDQFPPYAFLPFGGGRHTCIGRYLGLPQMMLGIASFVRHFDFEYTGTRAPQPLSLSTLKPDQSIQMRLRPREVHV